MSDYNFLMESRFKPEQYRVVTYFSRIAADQGLNLYLVGGAVRDLTYGQQVIRDLDFVVEGNPQKILRRLDSPGFSSQGPPGAPESATELAPLEVLSLHYDSRLEAAEIGFKGVRADLAMCRNEIYSKPGRRPEIVPATIFEDLRRRDFSINALAVSLHPNSRGLLLDPTNGAADIEKHEIRVLHSRSFFDDPSRIYRLLRFGVRLDFKPEEKTQRYLATALEEKLWENVDPEQRGLELRAILQEENPGVVLKMLAERDLLAGLDRKLASARIPYDRFSKIRSVMRSLGATDPLPLNFHALTEKLGSYRNQLGGKVFTNRREEQAVLNLDREARKLARVLSSSKAGLPSQVFNLLFQQPETLLLFLLVHYQQTKIQHRVKNYLFKYRVLRARLPRAELEALGMKPGPRFEKVLERVFLNQLDGKIRSHQQLISGLRALAGIKEPPPPPKPTPPPKSAPPAKAAKAAAAAAAKPAATVKPSAATGPARPPKLGKGSTHPSRARQEGKKKSVA